MTRIIYRKHPEREIYFTKQYPAGNKILHATIINKVNEETDRYQVIINDMNQGVLLYEQLCASFESAKRVVKNQFILQGVDIKSEIRKKIE